MDLEAATSSTRATWRPAAIILAVALAVRLLYLYQMFGTPLFETFHTDSAWYVAQAKAITHGEYTQHHAFFRAPLYPFFLATVYKLTGDSFTGARIVQHVLGAGACVALFLLGRRLGGPRVGWIAGLAGALYGPLIHTENEILAEALAIILFPWALVAAARALERPRFGWFLLAGLLLGLCAITRPNFVLLAPVFGLCGLAYFWKARALRRLLVDGVAFGVGLVITILPVTLHNRLIGGEWVLIATQGGVNFFIGNNPFSDGHTAVAPGPVALDTSDPFFENVWYISRLEAEKHVGHPLSESAVSAFWRDEGLRFWRELPGQALLLTWKKLYFFLNGFEVESIRSPYLDAFWSWLAGGLTWTCGLAFPTGLIWPLALLGLWRRGRDRGLGWLLGASLIVYSVSVIAFFVNTRLRVPMVPVLIVFTACGTSTLVELVRQRDWRRLRLWGIALAVLLLFCNSTLYGVRELNYARQANILGSAYNQLGQPARAAEYFRAAVEDNPENFDARMNLARTYLGLGRFADAETAIRGALAMAPDVSFVHSMLAQALSRQGRYDEATAEVKRALELNPREASAYHTWAEIALATGHYGEAWRHVHATQKLNYPVVPELLTELRAKLPEPPP